MISVATTPALFPIALAAERIEAHRASAAAVASQKSAAYVDRPSVIVVESGERVTLLLAGSVVPDGRGLVCRDVVWLQWHQPVRHFWQRAQARDIRRWEASEVALRRDVTGVLIAYEDKQHATFPQRRSLPCSIVPVPGSGLARAARIVEDIASLELLMHRSPALVF